MTTTFCCHANWQCWLISPSYMAGRGFSYISLKGTHFHDIKKRRHRFLLFQKELKTGDIKLPMSACYKCGGKLWNKPFENPWNGPIKWFSRVDFMMSHHIYSTGTLIVNISPPRELDLPSPFPAISCILYLIPPSESKIFQHYVSHLWRHTRWGTQCHNVT
jgi:hypothetical protein